jgi:signal transduction histidine kinase
MEELNYESGIPFSIDAGLIDRLGRELVGKAETAVSELVKNAYDADAQKVQVEFINTWQIGGKLLIRDNGDGMTQNDLIRGFMRISSPDKIHNPRSRRFNRSKAGRKGIGRFATQRLGRKLTIITQTESDAFAHKLVIDWDRYQIDVELSSVRNHLERVPKEQSHGTTLLIEDLRDYWTTKDIERVYRYVSELIQPDYLSDRSLNLQTAVQTDNSFEVEFRRTQDGVTELVANPQRMLFDKAIAVIEGFIDDNYEGFYGVKSESLGLDDYGISIEASKDRIRYNSLKNVHFKAYYFIYNRTEYYSNINKLELRNIQQLSNEYSGLRLYRNGFRVLPYGEPTDDWLALDVRYAGESAERTNVPFSTKNLFGFVEVIDPEGISFQETASREGLIDTAAFIELKDFVHKSLVAARLRIGEKIKLIRDQRKIDAQEQPKPFENPVDQFAELENLLNVQNNAAGLQALRQIRAQVENLLEEMGMLRVLAGLGLTIAEFTHEIIQFTPSINGYIFSLSQLQRDPQGIELLEQLDRTFKHFTSYTSYFNTTVSQNVSRELRPILLIDVVNNFVDVISQDSLKQSILIKTENFGFDLYTIPMHPSEWGSILFNLYTNSKKAIKRAGSDGRILIICGADEKENRVYVEFLDNGDGIPEENRDRIFNAFFTTSTPVSFDSENQDKLTGTGLGLKIIKDIIESHGGKIFVSTPEEEGYVTSFRIELPRATQQQVKDYGY